MNFNFLFQHFHVSRLPRFFLHYFPGKKIEAKEKGVMGGRVRVFKVKVGQNQKDQNDGVIGSRKK